MEEIRASEAHITEILDYEVLRILKVCNVEILRALLDVVFLEENVFMYS